MYDLILKGGRIYDGSGMPSFLGDIAINDGRIQAIGRINAYADHVLDISPERCRPRTGPGKAAFVGLRPVAEALGGWPFWALAAHRRSWRVPSGERCARTSVRACVRTADYRLPR